MTCWFRVQEVWDQHLTRCIDRSDSDQQAILSFNWGAIALQTTKSRQISHHLGEIMQVNAPRADGLFVAQAVVRLNGKKRFRNGRRCLATATGIRTSRRQFIYYSCLDLHIDDIASLRSYYCSWTIV